MRDGAGIQLFSNGDIFEGYFSENMIVQGKYMFANGATFKGVIADNTRFVNGKYSGSDWTYEGSFKDGMFDWIGVLTFVENGLKCKYEGKFDKGKFHGPGTLQVEGRETTKGTFRHGVFQDLSPVSPYKSGRASLASLSRNNLEESKKPSSPKKT